MEITLGDNGKGIPERVDSEGCFLKRPEGDLKEAFKKGSRREPEGCLHEEGSKMTRKRPSG